jgi:HEAT repeat protein
MRIPRRLYLVVLALAITGCHPHNTAQMPGPPPPPPAYPKAVAKPIDAKLQQAALAEVKSALHSSDEIIRTHALETIAEQNITDFKQQVIDALGDRSSVVRKSAALTIGRLKIAEAQDRLQPLLDAEQSALPQQAITAKQEELAAIFALHELGDTSRSHEFEQTAFDPRPQVRGDTVFMLGLIGDKSAIPLLQAVLRRDLEVNVRLQAAESLWKMGDEKGEEALIEATISKYASDQMLAIYALAEPRDTRLLGNIEGQYSNDYPEVRLVCARAAGMLGADSGYGIALQGAKSVDARHRALAALAIGAIGRTDSQTVLSTLLKDKDADVRIAAAGAIVAIGHKGV